VLLSWPLLRQRCCGGGQRRHRRDVPSPLVVLRAWADAPSGLQARRRVLATQRVPTGGVVARAGQQRVVHRARGRCRDDEAPSQRSDRPRPFGGRLTLPRAPASAPTTTPQAARYSGRRGGGDARSAKPFVSGPGREVRYARTRISSMWTASTSETPGCVRMSSTWTTTAPRSRYDGLDQSEEVPSRRPRAHSAAPRRPRRVGRGSSGAGPTQLVGRPVAFQAR
jgi:hypothetical protein